MKTCSKCKTEKPETEFSKRKDSRDGLRSHCKSCDAAKFATYRASNKDKITSYQAAYRASNRDKILADKAAYRASNRDKLSKYKAANRDKIAGYHYKRYYGLTFDQVKAMFIEQSGLCAICLEPLLKMPNVDHNHSTGQVRGLLCRGCNAGLGNFKEDWTILNRAVDYLNKGEKASEQSKVSDNGANDTVCIQ